MFTISCYWAINELAGTLNNILLTDISNSLTLFLSQIRDVNFKTISTSSLFLLALKLLSIEHHNAFFFLSKMCFVCVRILESIQQEQEIS